ncbi:MAG: hypothetical protein VZS44_05405 [Bacilli bacterium]|nr:hypothetical protein [Bacilli bacterium]
MDDYKDKQNILYNLFVNSVKKNKISHAYLIDGNNNEDAFDFVMAIVKFLICENNYTMFDKCGNCNICKRIDDNNYSEVKIIDSDGLIIKKEQLLELQSDFSKFGVEGNKRIYVIKDCDKMNKFASNSLLKFLEEPNDNIIAILFTNNVHKLLPTIISRCQYVRLKNEKILYDGKTINNFANFCCNGLIDKDNFINDESNIKMINSVIDFIKYFEENGLDIFIYLKKLWYNSFSERDNCILGIELILNFYYDIFNFYLGFNNYFFAEYYDLIKEISKYNNLDKIIKKINCCLDAIDNLKFNLNINLVIDNLLIELEESKYEYS